MGTGRAIRSGRVPVTQNWDAIRRLMWNYVSIVRNGPHYNVACPEHDDARWFSGDHHRDRGPASVSLAFTSHDVPASRKPAPSLIEVVDSQRRANQMIAQELGSSPEGVQPGRGLEDKPQCRDFATGCLSIWLRKRRTIGVGRRSAAQRSPARQ
jgi:hypothetical protein